MGNFLVDWIFVKKHIRKTKQGEVKIKAHYRTKPANPKTFNFLSPFK